MVDSRVDWDSKQLSAIAAAPDSRLLVEAPPGTGKTETACARVAHLIREGDLAPSNIWLISFTRTAVKEIRDRISQILADQRLAKEVNVATLDSVAFRIRQGLRSRDTEKLGDSFDANITGVIRMLRDENEDLLEYIEEFEHVVVDEAQDLVGLRGELVMALVKNVMPSCGFSVFADSAQAIYGWTLDENQLGSDGQPDPRFSSPLSQILRDSFEVVHLDAIHRAKTDSLRQLFTEARNFVLDPNIDSADRYEKVKGVIEERCDGRVNDITEQDIADADDTIVLYRTRVEALQASSFLLSSGISHRVRMSGVPACIQPWVGTILHDKDDRYLNDSEFAKLWSDRISGTVNESLTMDDAWSVLEILAHASGGNVDTRRLRDVLARPDPPVELSFPDLIGSGPIVGTIHASKGREADAVHLMLPAADPEPEFTDMDEEASVLFVGATRASRNLLVGRGYSNHGRRTLGSGRVSKRPRKNGDKAAQIELGRRNDIDPCSCVMKNVIERTDDVIATQKLLADPGQKPRKLLCTNQDRSDYTYGLYLDDSRDQLLCNLTQNVNSELFDAGKRLKGKQDSRKMRPASKFYNVFLIGARTVALPVDDERLQMMHEPYRSSGIWLAPIIYGLPLVYFNQYGQ